MVESAGKDSRRNGHQKSVSTKKTHRVRFLEYPADGDGDGGLLGELGATDVEGIESVRAIGTVLEQVFLRFGEFLAALVLTKAVSATADPCGLQGKD